jgi:glycosyltransferase involved in cell wall biosynthesis
VISVVTPTLNAERYLAECLASLSFGDLEHLVVDGGSTDRTVEMVRQHPGSLCLVRPGLNQAAAINEGLRAATGEVVAWLNADDAYAPDALSVVAAQFAADPALDALIGDCAVVDPNSKPLWYERPGPYDFQRLLRRGNYLAQPAVFLRKRVLDSIGLLDESLEYAMDYDLWLRLQNARVQYVPQILAMFRWHPRSKTAQNTLGNWRENLRILRRYGGGWTPELAWSCGRAMLSVVRSRLLPRAPRERAVREPQLPDGVPADSSESHRP